MEFTESGQKEKQKPSRWQPSILVYLIVMNFVILCLLFPTMGLYFFRQETAFQNLHLERMLVQMRHDLESRSSSLAQSLALSAGQAIAGFDFSFLNTLMSQVVIDNHEAIYTYIMDPNRRILAHNDVKNVGHTLEDTTSILIADTENKIYLASLTAETQPTTVQFYDLKAQEGDASVSIMEAVTPVYSGATLAGFLRCGFFLKDLDTEMAAVRQEWADKIKEIKFTFVSITVFFFLVGMAISFLFTRTFVRSMRVLKGGVEKISRGDLKHRILMEGLVCQEFTHLSDSFNSMTEKLGISHEQLEQYSKNLEQKVLERTEDLKVAQTNLLQQAHEAGMAEMAVGILHNIGNAITPAKVSTVLLIRKIKESRIRNNIKDIMGRLNTIIAEPSSLPQDEKEQLQQIVAVLPDAVIEEYDHINSEVKRIRAKHEHIESIIHLQLRYARLSGNIENVNVNKVVLDSVEMLEEILTKYSVAITNDLDPDLPIIKSEQSKILQVTVNLIKNAVEAMRDVDQDKRMLAITTHTASNGEDISISIKDTGMGFAPEEKKNLFSYGYTTKKEGSGFGLHSCANFLIANKGSIEAISNGPGTGAEFIVHLPISRDDENNENEDK
jgi:C4-dicarboxylate-specific signal transduction histidine kinase